MPKNGSTLTYRVGKVEDAVDKLDVKMDLVMENHLPHLQRAIDANANLIKYATLINVGAILLAAVLLKFL